jgi:hypothetical protein
MWWLLLAFAAVDPADVLPERIRQRVAENLARLPDYTCLMTIDRSARGPEGGNWRAVDRLRLEVSFVGGKELYSWPGARKFEDRPIHDLVGPGALIGNGDFALHSRALFIRRTASITCGGEADHGGRRWLECRFDVPPDRSEYSLQMDGVSAVTPYHGRVLVDPKTLDLHRIEITADRVPKQVGLRKSTHNLEYAVVRIGGTDFLLPRASEVTLTENNWQESRNRTEIGSCRQYAGAATISFGDPDAAATSAKPPEPISVPAGLEIETVIATPVNQSAATGDPVVFTVLRPVKKDGREIIPKGAKISGRLTMLRKRWHANLEYTIAGFLPHTLEFAGRMGDLRANLQEAGLGNQCFVPYASNRLAAPSIWNSLREHPTPAKGESILYLRGSAFRVPIGLRMLWSTE